jgi:RNA polymerase sigma-70 factor (ECF subfamily)
VTRDAHSPPRPPPITDDIDDELIKSTLTGNQQSFNELIKRHQPALLLMVQRHLRQREEAEDVVQHVFLKAYQHLATFRREARFFTWLYTIALNVIRNHVRQRNLRRMDSLDVPAKTDDSRAPQWPDKAPSPEKIAQDRWDIEQVRAALANLMEPHRTIFTLHYFQHLSLKDVATRIKRPLGTVKVYLHRARKMIFSELVTE